MAGISGEIVIQSDFRKFLAKLLWMLSYFAIRINLDYNIFVGG